MEVKRIFDILDNLNEKYPDKADALACKKDGAWIKHSTKEYHQFANYVSYGLLKLGFNRGDKIATVSNNRPEWNFADMGMLQVGVVHVPIYPTISDKEYRHILKHSDAKILLVSNEDLYKRLSIIVDEIESIKEIYTFDQIEGAKNFNEIIELGKKSEDYNLRGTLVNRKAEISEDDLATIIYTSGTTGLPKGVMLSHKTFTFQAKKIAKLVPINNKHRMISFLPLCHVLERVGGYAFQYIGTSIYYAEGIEKVAENIKEIQPHGFITVPRLLEKVYDKIVAKGKELEGKKKDLFFWALNLGEEYEFSGKGFAYYAKLKAANLLIFSKWREALGGNIKMIISGGAALQPRLARVFHAAQIPVYEGYGLSETAPVIAVNRPGGTMFGTVGPVLSSEQDVKIAEDGEILFKGPNLMQGYLKDEEKTKEAIDTDGWFHTGDIGTFVDGRYLKITDRKKEMFKLSTGKYVAPGAVENVLKESFFIEQLMIVGENEKFAGALVSPNFEFLHDWCHDKKIHYRDNKELIEHPEVISRYQEELDEFNKKLGHTERIKRFELVCEEWTPDTGELSPTLKLKRRVVKEKYKDKIKKIYLINK